MDRDQLSPTGSRSPLPSPNSSSQDNNPPPATADDHNDPHIQRPPRACQYCRQHKVRCDIDSRDPSRPCERCLKANRDCVTGSFSRKRRKTTDSRVLDLERKVESLNSRLEKLERNGNNDGEQAVKVPTPSSQNQTESAAHITPSVVVQSPLNNQDTGQTQPDVVDRQILSLELASRIFQHYVTEIAPIFPVVPFCLQVVPEAVRKQKPTLFLAILVVAAGEFDVSLQTKLHSELLRRYSDQIIYYGVKSLDIIQALIVTALWNYLPEHVGGSSINIFCHIAAVMATDLSMTKSSTGKKFPPTEPKVEQQWYTQALLGLRPMIASHKVDSSLPESRRTVLACYFLCSNISRRLRRPNSFPFNSYMSECIDFFETTAEPGVFISDNYLVQWIRITRIAEEFCQIHSAGDPTDLNPNSRAEIVLEGFLDKMAKWRQKAADIITPVLDLFAQNTTKAMYDAVLHFENPMEDARLPGLETLIAQVQQSSNLSPGRFHDEAERTFITLLHSCIDGFLAFPTEFIRMIPSFFYVEVGYAIGVLVKIYFNAALCAPTNHTLDPSEIKFNDYIDRLVVALGTVTKDGRRHRAERLRLAMIGMKDWVGKNQQKMSGLISKRALAPPLSPPPPPPAPQVQQAYLGDGVYLGLPFVGDQSDTGRGDAVYGVGLQGMGGEPMAWDNVPLIDLFQFDRAPGFYPAWG